MDKKKLYFIIGGVVLAVVIVVALIIGLGGNKTENPADVANPTINEVVDETVDSTIDGTEPTISETEGTVPGDTTGNQDETIDDSTDETIPGNTDETIPGGENDFPVDPDGYYYIDTFKPEVDMEDINDILNVLDDDKIREQNDIVINTEYNDQPATIIHDTVSNVVIVDYSKTEDSVTREYYDSNTGELIDSCTTYDDGTEVRKTAVSFGYYERDETKCIYREYDKNNKLISEVTYKVVNGKAYILSGYAKDGTKITVKYHGENSTVMSEMIWEGESYFHCKWSSGGNSDGYLTYYNYSGSGKSSTQSGSVNLYMLPSPPNPANLFYYL